MSQLVSDLSLGTITADENSIYRALNRFENLGIVISSWRDSDIGPRRRYYRLTVIGMELLGMFIHQNVLIDPVMDYLKSVVLLAPMRYLLRAPLLADQSFDQDPGGGFYTIPGFLTSVQSKPMSLLGSIAFQSVIAPDLVSDCGYMNLDKAGNIRLVVSCFISAYRRVYSV